jgi:hypothetical protein
VRLARTRAAWSVALSVRIRARWARWLDIFIFSSPTWSTDELILRTRLRTFTTDTRSIPHLLWVLIDGNVLSPFKCLESFAVEKSLHCIYATPCSVCQLLVSMLAMVLSEPVHEGVGYDYLLGHIVYLQ